MLGIFLFCIYWFLACIIIYYLRHPNNQKWWIKVVTQEPSCTYYFGPFDSATEAQLIQAEYIQDIQEERAEGISAQIQQCQPQQLTIFDEDSEATQLIGSSVSDSLNSYAS